MRRAFRRRALSMTSLVDVIFLLLLFFMLTSTFSRFAEIEISTATTGAISAEAAETRDTSLLSVGTAALQLDGLPVGLEALPDRLDDQILLVSLRPDVSAQRLVDVLAVLRSVPEVQIRVLQ